MSDDTSTPVPPASPPPADARERKATTRIISILPAEGDRSRSTGVSSSASSVPTPKTIQLKRPPTTPIHLSNAPLQPQPPLERKGETIRISLTDVLPSSRKPADVKRATTPVAEASTVAAPVPPTIQLKRPATSPIFIKPDEAMTAAPAKSKTSPLEAPTAARPPFMAGSDKKGTSRLILETAGGTQKPGEPKRATSPITVIPQTIRLKRPATVPFSMMADTVTAGPTPVKDTRPELFSEAPTVVKQPGLSQAKMATSRVLIEAVPAPKVTGEAKRTTSPITTIPAPIGTAPTPRTIRLKRPPSTIVEEGTTGAEAETVLETAQKADTAKIELPKEAELIPITQRKTIKIKRTERNVAPRTVTLRQPAPAVSPEPGPAVSEEVLLPEEKEWSPVLFAIAAAAVVLITCLVYIMASQSFGPELALPVPSSLL